jgi:hypothetical protein
MVGDISDVVCGSPFEEQEETDNKARKKKADIVLDVINALLETICDQKFISSMNLLIPFQHFDELLDAFRTGLCLFRGLNTK